MGYYAWEGHGIWEGYGILRNGRGMGYGSGIPAARQRDVCNGCAQVSRRVEVFSFCPWVDSILRPLNPTGGRLGARPTGPGESICL